MHDGFFQRVAQLLGGEIAHRERLDDDVWKVRFHGDRRIVVKSVARQSMDGYDDNGKMPREAPWTELVVLDLLAAEGAPVPRLLAYDLHNRWLAMDYVAGHRLGDRLALHGVPAFASLVDGLDAIQKIMAREAATVAPFVEKDHYDYHGLVTTVGALLPDHAQPLWSSLQQRTELPRVGDAPSASHASAGRDDPTPAYALGPLDVNDANVLWLSDGVCFIDMASIGYAPTELRLTAYAQRPVPATTLLVPETFSYYFHRMGLPALHRLILFDYVFWGTAISRAIAAYRHPQSAVARQQKSVWGEPERVLPSLLKAWSRPRWPENIPVPPSIDEAFLTLPLRSSIARFR